MLCLQVYELFIAMHHMLLHIAVLTANAALYSFSYNECITQPCSIKRLSVIETVTRLLSDSDSCPTATLVRLRLLSDSCYQKNSAWYIFMSINWTMVSMYIYQIIQYNIYNYTII